MKAVFAVIFLLNSAIAALGQLSPDQKVFDFEQLAGQFAKQYAPYEWKRDNLKVDLLNVKPWLERIRNSKTDLDFYEISSQYVSSLTDVHSEYYTPSTFFAFLPIRFDIYDGRVLVDSISRSSLPASRYPFEVGDELVSIDGQTPAEFIKTVNRFQSYGNPRSTDRWSASYLGFLDQSVIPKAPQVGDNATVVIRRQSGDLETYQIAWRKSGRPLVQNGPVPSPKSDGLKAASLVDAEPIPTLSYPRALSETFDAYPAYLQALLQHQRNVRPGRNLRNFGAAVPTFTMPSGFTQHRNSFFYDGVFTAQGKRIGYLRIGNFEPTAFQDLDIPITVFEREIAYLQANTDGLVIDVMRNPGGFGCYAEELLTRVIPYRFASYGQEVRPTYADVNSYYDAVDAAVQDNSPQWVITLLQKYAREVEAAYGENRGLTGPLPACTESFDRDPATDSNGTVIAYTKPAILLVDEFTTSAADIFSAIFQDAGRGPLVGFRTSGAGGSVGTVPAGTYGEATTTITQTLVVRPKMIATPEFPTTNLIENVGVRPDVEADYMTRTNLLNGGADFVNRFTQVMLDQLNQNN